MSQPICSAVMSDCGNYRYRLERSVCPPRSDSRVIAFFGINPSTADASIDDATVRKWKGFAARNNCHRFIVGNVFSYRATDVRQLANTPFQQGPAHFTHMQEILADADILVPCWGSRYKVPKTMWEQIDLLMAWLKRSGKPVMHFGLTGAGDPKHPLMLAYSTPLLPWDDEL